MSDTTTSRDLWPEIFYKAWKYPHQKSWRLAGVIHRRRLASRPAPIVRGSVLDVAPPIRPSARAAASPAQVRSTINSRSISARAPITWKKKRPIGVLVSILSVRLLKLMPRLRKSSISETRFRILRPSLSSFHTISVSPSESALKSFFRPGLSAVLPLILSSKISSHPALSSAFLCRAVFWSFVDTRT